MRTASTAPAVAAATRGTYASFLGNGFAIASWAARIPQVRDHFHLSPAALGLVLLAVAAGTFITLPLSGVLIHRFTSRVTVLATALLASVALAIAAGGYLIGVAPMVIGLFLFGVAVGAWDPAQNVQGAVVERRLGRSIMPRFHAAFSVGTVGGAVVGVGMVALQVPVPLHLTLVAVLVGVAVALEARHFLPDTPEEAPAQGTGASGRAGGALRRWLEPRTLAIGAFVLAFAFTEGAGNDWIGVALIDGYRAPAALGTLAFAVFLAGMTGARWFGSSLLDRYGRVATVRGLAGVAILGLLLFVFGRTPGLAFLGALLWGMGASLGFPSGMSAAADEPAAAAGRVGVVASIGYLAFLGGPPFVGFLGDRFTVLRALSAVALVLVVSTLLAGALRPRRAAGQPSALAGR
ncbi:MAG: MFS transporter [Chloroflexi bacterium]|nr:MFS transporter [Chloroflexota bacterium]